ncbi:MAG: hypothetical protein HYV09_08605 [Deltaproteobacteria bacterium]|nr:hypothetical protein [Deltaproteobacteria bacterium]
MRTAIACVVLVALIGCDGGEPSGDGGVGDAATSCGGKAAIGCPTGMWCFFADGTCSTHDALGTCRKREALPCVAPAPGDEVCGCDGKTYQSQCVAISAGQSVARAGAC